MAVEFTDEQCRRIQHVLLVHTADVLDLYVKVNKGEATEDDLDALVAITICKIERAANDLEVPGQPQ